jgi:tRNA(Ile)-lysidine synthase
LVPLLEKHFSGWKQGLEALGDTQSLAAEFIQAEARCRVIWEGAGEELRTPAENFFAQPLIIREEALFQALNKRGVPPTVAVKRRTVRCFANREMGEADLGFCRISVTGQEDAAYIRIFRPRGAVEAGFSLLIKEPGLYKLRSDMSRGLTLAVSEGPACECQAPLQGGAAGFFIGIPFVLRNARGDDVLVRQGGKRLSPKEPALAGGGKARDTVVYTVQDAAGVAAFIGVCPGGIVILRRETVLNEKLFSCDIGGIDAQ